MKVDIKPEARRQFLQKHLGDQMMGRCFCHTQERWIGLEWVLALWCTLYCVPLGCSTSIHLRLEGIGGEYRFVGDIYIDRYMFGEAVEEMGVGI